MKSKFHRLFTPLTQNTILRGSLQGVIGITGRCNGDRSIGTSAVILFSTAGLVFFLGLLPKFQASSLF
jgi:hypothetical protein